MIASTIIFATITLFSCATANASQVDRILRTQVKPSRAIKAQIVNAARDYLFDPYSVRDAEISALVTLDEKRDLTGLCVKANAKNQYGGYTGRQTISIRFQRSQIIGSWPNDPACKTPGLRWFRFKELERLRDL